jgi:hypothetical protein
MKKERKKKKKGKDGKNSHRNKSEEKQVIWEDPDEEEKQ